MLMRRLTNLLCHVSKARPLLALESVTLSVLAVSLHRMGMPSGGDDIYYRQLALSISDGSGMVAAGHPTAFVTPGYPLFLALIMILGGEHYLVVTVIVQACILALTAYLSGDLARLMGFDDRVRVLAQLAVAFYPPFVISAAMTLTETLFTGVVISVMWLWARAAFACGERLTGRFVSFAIVSAIVVGVGVAVRPTAVLLPAALAAALVLTWRKQRVVMARCFAVLLVGAVMSCALFVGVWGLRNQRMLGGFVPLSTEAPYVAYCGNLVSAHGEGGRADVVQALGSTRADEIEAMSELERMRTFRSLFLNEVATHPMAVIGLWPSKAARFWFNLGYRNSPSRSSIVVALVSLGLLVGTFTGARVAFGLNAMPRAITLTILLFMLLLLLAHVATYAVIRYAYPALALSIVFSAAALIHVRDRLFLVPRSRSQGSSSSTEAT